MTEIKLARVYMSESEDHLNEVLKILHTEIKVQHVVVLRGIEGFEKDGEVQTSHFLSLSLDLPLVVEFFDTPQQVARATTKIQGVIDKGHILILQGQVAS
jgi:PII-like signaling protein